ncbi:MAG: TauD/TfdA family dioxygenase [Pseudonocardia sp.]
MLIKELEQQRGEGLPYREGVAAAEFEPLVKGLGFVPERLAATEATHALPVVERDGAVILTGWPVEQGSPVRAAAAVLGTRLRWLETVSAQTTTSGALPLHTDGANVFVDIHDRRERVRDPDIDYVLILCDTPAPTGGESLVCDGYRLIERIREGDPELYEFLTTVDIETGSGGGETPRVARMVEWTRAGRLVVRSDPWSTPRPRDWHAQENERFLVRYSDLLATLAAQAPSTRLASGEILMLDNYRCPHSVGPHDGRRLVHVLRLKSVDAH